MPLVLKARGLEVQAAARGMCFENVKCGLGGWDLSQMWGRRLTLVGASPKPMKSPSEPPTLLIRRGNGQLATPHLTSIPSLLPLITTYSRTQGKHQMWGSRLGMEVKCGVAGCARACALKTSNMD